NVVSTGGTGRDVNSEIPISVERLKTFIAQFDTLTVHRCLDGTRQDDGSAQLTRRNLAGSEFRNVCRVDQLCCDRRRRRRVRPVTSRVNSNDLYPYFFSLRDGEGTDRSILGCHHSGIGTDTSGERFRSREEPFVWTVVNLQVGQVVFQVESTSGLLTQFVDYLNSDRGTCYYWSCRRGRRDVVLRGHPGADSAPLTGIVPSVHCTDAGVEP